MPLNPLQSDSIRPSDGTSTGPISRVERTDAYWLAFSHPCIRRAEIPVRRPSGGVAQGDARQDAERGTKGQGRPFVTAPGAAPEGGNPAAGGAGCRGALLFGDFLLGTQEKVTRRNGEKGRFVQRIGLENKSVPFFLTRST